MNGTGPFELATYNVGQNAVLKASANYWGTPVHLDEVEFIDLGDDAGAAIAAMASKQVDGLYEVDFSQLDAVKALPDVVIYQVTTAQTAVVRGKYDQKPFNDVRVRQALKLAIDQQKVIDIVFRGRASVGEHHHVAPVHPEYAKLPMVTQDIAKAKQLVAEAGYPDGLPLEIACKGDPAWELASVQVMVEMWKAAGINVKINLMPSASFWAVWEKVPFGYTAWTHRPLGVMVLGLAYRTGVPWNEFELFEPRIRQAADTGRGNSRSRQAPRGHGQAGTDPAAGWPDRAAALAHRADWFRPEGEGIPHAPDAVSSSLTNWLWRRPDEPAAMARQIIRRFGWMLATMLAASLLLFLLFELLPGDVALAELGPYSTPEQRHLWLVANGYDQPIVMRYLDWLGHFIIGQWGQSRIFLAPVARIVWLRLENTAILGFWFFVCLIPLSLGMGVLGGHAGRIVARPRSLRDLHSHHLDPAIRQHGAGLGGLRLQPALAARHQYDAGRFLLPATRHAGAGAGALRLRLHRAHHPCGDGRGHEHAVYPRGDPARPAVSPRHFTSCTAQCADRAIHPAHAARELADRRGDRRRVFLRLQGIWLADPRGFAGQGSLSSGSLHDDRRRDGDDHADHFRSWLPGAQSQDARGVSDVIEIAAAVPAAHSPRRASRWVRQIGRSKVALFGLCHRRVLDLRGHRRAVDRALPAEPDDHADGSHLAHSH